MSIENYKSLKRIGFCCKWINDISESQGMKINAKDRDLNGRSTTMRWLREHKEEAEQRQWDIMNHNASAACKMIERVGTLPPERRMVRLGSEMLQGYTEKDWIDWWQQKEVQNHLEKIFAPVGEASRKHNVKISFHPGQFCVLASATPDIVERSILEFEYHADMARWMGFGKSFQDGCKLNVHISGKQGPAGIKAVLPRLSQEARNLITIENDEMSHGLDQSLMLEKDLALVLDIHHHWIRDEEYINPNDDRVKRVVDSWRGVRPTLHYSYSRDEALAPAELGDKMHTEMHNIKDLIAKGCKKQKLRAHSDLYPNDKVNDWALSFNENFDIQTESKAKNLSAEQLYNKYLSNKKVKETA
jgi:UV DNA damage repair endonuclease